MSEQLIQTGEYKIFSYYKVDPQHPYPGLYSFREQDSEFFFGRPREIKDLEKLIDYNVLTFVFGKSGIGKTSLLRAGLIPKLRSNYYLPVYMRINFGDGGSRPIVQAKEIITARIHELDPAAPAIGEMTLWEYFHSFKILNGFVRPLLFFDQFEEIFTSGKDHGDTVNEFITEIADLVEDRVPVVVQERFKNETKSILTLEQKSNFRVILSLREDYLPQLETLYRYIPSIRFSRFRVTQIKGKDAVDAVLKPGKEIIKDDNVAMDIIEKIPESKDVDYKPYENRNGSWKNKKVEPFLLSLFCYQVNEKRLEKKAAEISRELLEDINAEDLIKDYYEENINRFDSNVRAAIEDLLLTDEGYRKLQDKDSLKSGYGVSDDDIERLVDRRIIRKETRIDVDYIELIHDVLCPILKENRDKRKLEARREEELAKKKRKYSRIIFAIVSIAAVFLALLTRYAFEKKAEADEQAGIARKQTEIAQTESLKNKAYSLAAYSINLQAKDASLGFRLAQAAYQTGPGNPAAYNALLHSFYNGGFYILLPHHDQVKAAVFSGDGKYIITKDRDQRIRYWDFTGKEIEPPGAAVTDINTRGKDRSPGGGTVAIADHTVQLKSRGGDVIRVFRGHTGDVNSAVFSPDGKYILTAGNDNAARLWPIAIPGNKPREFTGHSSETSDFFAVYCPGDDCNHILTVNGQKVLLWDVSGGNPAKEIPVDPVYKPVAAFSPDGKTIAVTGPEEQRVLVLNTDGVLIRELGGHNTGANSVAFSPGADARKIITACLDNTAWLWEGDNEESRAFTGHIDEVNSAVFSPDGQFIVTASWDKTARLWGLDGTLKETFEHKDGVHSAVFSPDGQSILTACKDETAILWNLHGELLVVFEGHTGEVKSAAFSPDGKFIITAGDDRTVRLWDLKGAQVFKFEGFNDVIRTASFSPGGTHVLIAPARGPAQLRLIGREKIIAIVDNLDVWRLDDEHKEKYGIGNGEKKRN
jgi:WD40 repeat protein